MFDYLNKGRIYAEDIDKAINATLGLRTGLMGIFEISNLDVTGGRDVFQEVYGSQLVFYPLAIARYYCKISVIN